MKILLSNAVVAHGAFHHWMTQDLRALGHEVATIDPDELCEQFGIELYRRVLLQRIAAERPDIFVVYPPYDLLRPRDADAIRSMGTAIVGFAYDEQIFFPSYTRRPGDFKNVVEHYGRVYDVYVTTSREMEREAASRGLGGVRHIRWACNTPAPFDAGRVRDLPIVVIGAAYPRRVKMVKHLKDRGLAPIVFGVETWKMFADVADCYRGMLTRPGMFEMYGRAQIALAPADWESTYTPMVKLRTLEIMSTGAFQLCEACEDLADYYADGTEIVSYKTWDELADKARHYLANPQRRQEIARAGYDRTCRDHVWRVRWAEIEELARESLARYRAAKSAPAQADHHLPHELGLSACAGYYESISDLATTEIALDEWLGLSGDYFTPLLAKGRVLLAQGRWAEAEQCLDKALIAGEELGLTVVDMTVTQRKLGNRSGLGRLFPGMFPRQVEVWAHLLWLYAAQDRSADVERLMGDLARRDQDILFISIVALISDAGAIQRVGPKYMARYAEVVIGSTPRVWEGERVRHLAHFWLMRGQALVAAGQSKDGRECLEYALTQKPYPAVERTIRDELRRVPR